MAGLLSLNVLPQRPFVLEIAARDALPQMSLVMVEFVLPLTMATLAVVAWRVARQGSSPRTAEAAPR